MKISGYETPDTTEGIIGYLKLLESGFDRRTDYTGQYHGRGESEGLRAKIEDAVNEDVSNDKMNPMGLNFRPVNPDAYRVEGGEVGFSAREPIGTDNTHDCVAVMLHDPVSKKTALAHIGGDTTEASLQLLWDGMQPASSLEMRIMGGRQLPVTAAEGDPARAYQVKNNQVAQWNVEKVVRFFKDKPVNVLSADIFTPEQPATVVVDPQTFTITETVPGKENPNAYVNGLGLLNDGNFLEEGPEGKNPLVRAFDLTQSPARDPVAFTPGQQAQLGRLMTMEKPQLEAYFKAKGNSGLVLEQSLERFESLREAYLQQINRTVLEPAGLKWSSMARNQPGYRPAGQTLDR